jgi:hypothetical protein
MVGGGGGDLLRENCSATVLSETITCVEVQSLSSDTQVWDYVDSAYRDDPFRMCLIRCEDHLLWVSWIDTMVSTSGEKPQAMEMTMGEWKDCVSYYADLFDKEDVEDNEDLQELRDAIAQDTGGRHIQADVLAELGL